MVEDCIQTAKMGAGSSAEITPNAPKFISQNLTAQVQKFEISLIKLKAWNPSI